MNQITLHPKAEVLWEKHQYTGLEGGRGSGKSHDIGTHLVDQSVRGKELILCCREIQDSIADSSKALIENKIFDMGYAGMFRITDKEILCVPTGTRFIFKGLGHKVSKIQSLEGVTITWMEEAHAVTDHSIVVLFPTVLRKPGSRIIASWNGQTEKDPIKVRLTALMKGGEDCVIVHKNYYENPNLPDELLRQALFAKENNPDEYDWIWLGRPKPDNASLKIILRAWLMKCVQAYSLWYDDVDSAVIHAGLDVAESPQGDDNCLTVRRGPALTSCDSWRPDPEKGPTPRAHRLMMEYGPTKVFYDAGGVGSSLKRDFKTFQERGEKGNYTTTPFLFGGSVQGKDKPYIRSGKETITNGNYFARLNAQAWWNIRQRAINTINRLNGDNIDLNKCLLINPNIPDLDKLIDQLSSATYDENSSGKITVNKYGDGDDSPDKADSVIMAYSHDLRRGLRA